jgi:LAO/AO transport system kinase
VLTCSGLTGTGLDAVWEQITQHRKTLQESGELAEKRSKQQVDWTWAMVREQLLGRLAERPSVRAVATEIERLVRAGEITASLAAQRILDAFDE